MINRELIRIKTVQLLYSYLLVENPFSLESQPPAPTKEKRFAYALYLDLLFLMTRIAPKIGVRSGMPLANTRFIRNVKTDEKIMSLKAKGVPGEYAFSNAEEGLIEKIKESGIYKNYLKSVENGLPDEKVWKNIYELILLTDETLNREIESRENFTLKGVDRMRGIMEETFSNFFASADNIGDALKVLNFSMDKTRELYFRLLALPIAVTELRERDIENARFKLIKSEEDINPNMRFVDNELVKSLRQNEKLQEGIAKYNINWLSEDEDTVRNLLRIIMQSELYREYVEFPVTDFKTDCELWRNIFRYIILLDENFMETMEEKSVFWNDDYDVIGTFVTKSFKKLGTTEAKTGETADGDIVLPMFKDEEDSEFGAKLFAEVVKNKDYYRELILENIDKKQWEVERLAFMDTVILMTALAEIINFPKVPLTVSFNEYIEIAKYYSTPRSGVFINGILGKIVSSLQEKRVIHKSFN